MDSNQARDFLSAFAQKAIRTSARPATRLQPRTRSCAWVSLALLGLALPTLGQGQGQAAGQRPRIGLALAGGSALGEAHIGVLEWFEQHHIPIDYVAGTSMGGLVGGAYASGMTPAEIRGLLGSVDWTDVLAGEPPYQTLSFRRKEDRRNVPTRLVYGLRQGLPSGLDPAQPIDQVLSRISLPYPALASFDELPVPFRCMAVDMESGTAVTLGDGSLATALRATMSIPAVFTPVERDGRLLTDGGTLNSIPTEAVKAMGADIVIAVDLHSRTIDRDALRSLIGILGQTAAIAVRDNERRSLALADVVITPNLDGLTGADFGKVDALAARGYAAAEARSAILSRLALPDAEWQAYLMQRHRRERAMPPPPAFVRVQGVSRADADLVRQSLQGFVGVPLAPHRLEAALTALTGTGRFDSLLYEQTQDGGETGLLIHAKARETGPTFVRIGSEIDGSDPDNVRFLLAGRLTALDVGTTGAEVRADLGLGSDTLAAAEYYRPLGGGRWFLAPRLFYQDVRTNLYEDRSRVAVYGVRTAGAALDLGYNTGRDSELRVGYQWSSLNAAVRTGSRDLPTLSGAVRAATLRWAYDGQDSPTVPTRGTRLMMVTNTYFTAPGAERTFPTAEIRGSSFQPISAHGSLFGILGAGTAFGSHAPPPQQFTLGGPLRLGAYGLDEFRGDSYVLLLLGWLSRPSHGVSLGGWYETGNVSGSLGNGAYHQDLSIGAVLDTALGPMLIGGSLGESGRTGLYYSLGRLF